MNSVSLPDAAIRSAFEQAARTHASARGQGPVAPPRVLPQPTGRVEQAIASAAQQTTIDFDFLVAQAQVESAMNPDARARTSSATGLYQFIDSTWLGTMRRHGERFGLGDMAAQIGTSASGEPFVRDPAARDAILALRSDPQVAALMAAGLAEDNRAHLTPILGRQPDHGELYLAHFLGAGGAGRFLSAMAENPDQSAAALFRAPAAANRPIFYERDGTPRSLAGVMSHLSAKLERARGLAPAAAPDGYAPPGLAPQFAQLRASAPGPEPRPIASLGASRLALVAPPSRGSMSSLLRDTFGENLNAGTPGSTGQVRRAYQQLKAFGL